MKIEVTELMFIEEFKALRPDNFTTEGLSALYNHLVEYEQDTGHELELDVIALCCDFTEYKNLAEFQEDYGSEKFPTLEDIHDWTIVIPMGAYGEDGPFIIHDF